MAVLADAMSFLFFQLWKNKYSPDLKWLDSKVALLVIVWTLWFRVKSVLEKTNRVNYFPSHTDENQYVFEMIGISLIYWKGRGGKAFVIQM